MKIFSYEKYKKDMGYTDETASDWAKKVAGMPVDEIKEKFSYEINDAWIEEFKMTKEDLKDGDIVTLKNGDRLVLFSGEFTDLEREGHWIDDLDDYEDDLRTCDRFYNEYDIVKVERPVEYETVFTRDDAVELTVDEISEKLGYKVKVVGEDR